MRIIRRYSSALTVPAARLEALRARLRVTGWPVASPGAGWSFGVDQEWLRVLCARWEAGDGFALLEKALTAVPSVFFEVETEGFGTLHVHAFVAGGTGHARPILMTHGWPSLSVEYIPVIEQLRARERQASSGGIPTLVAPSLPGFGWSSAPSRPMHARDIARLWRLLIDEGLELGPVIAHGGDWGAVVSSWLAVDAPERVAGLHLTMMGLKPDIDVSDPLDDAERSWIRNTQKRLAADGGYRELQASRPSTLSVGLADSPAFVLAWIAEKLHQWSGPAAQQDPERLQSAILTLASSYWLTGSLGSAAWIYWADRHEPQALAGGERCLVPTGYSGFGGGFFPPPPSRWIERAHRLVYRNELPVGGHFPGWMASATLADELQRFTIALNT